MLWRDEENDNNEIKRSTELKAGQQNQKDYSNAFEG